MEVVDAYMRHAHAADLYPDHYVVHQKQGNRVTIECERTGAQFQPLNFGCNDIFGLAQHPAVKQAAIAAIERYGASNSSCATLCGRIDIHRLLEQEISDFKGLPHTYLFLNAWMALQAVIDGFCHLAMPVPGFRHTRQTVIFTDIYNHGCITSAIVNADNRSGKMFTQSPKVTVKPYRHADMTDLARKMNRYAGDDRRIIVITDAVFSMDGDVAPLPEMVEVMANHPGSVLILDEAHSSGALGQTGHGICEHFHLSPTQIQARGVQPIIMTTFSKFAASAGAAISCFSKSFTQLLDACPTSIGTISLPPATAAAALAAIQQVRARPQLPQTLRDRTAFLRNLLRENGFETLGDTHVVPIIPPAEMSPKYLARHLLEQHNLWVSPVWFIAKPRLRVVVNVLHTQDDLRALVDALVATRDFFCSTPVLNQAEPG